MMHAVSTSRIAELEARAAVVDAILPPAPNGRKFILSVLIGRNDLLTLGTSTWLTNLASYLDDRIAARWTVVLGTILPSTLSGFNAARNTANTTLRTWVGTHCHYICDFAADPTMGPDAAAADTTYYSDGTHFTAAGAQAMADIYGPVIDAVV